MFDHITAVDFVELLRAQVVEVLEGELAGADSQKAPFPEGVRGDLDHGLFVIDRHDIAASLQEFQAEETRTAAGIQDPPAPGVAQQPLRQGSGAKVVRMGDRQSFEMFAEVCEMLARLRCLGRISRRVWGSGSHSSLGIPCITARRFQGLATSSEARCQPRASGPEFIQGLPVGCQGLTGRSGEVVPPRYFSCLLP